MCHTCRYSFSLSHAYVYRISGSASKTFLWTTPSIVILMWTLTRLAGTFEGVSCNWIVDKYPFVLAEWYTKCIPFASFRLSWTAWDSTKIALRSGIWPCKEMIYNMCYLTATMGVKWRIINSTQYLIIPK